MSDQEKAGRLMTFEEFAPQCVVAADCWLKAHPQDPQCDWDNNYGLIHSLRDCLQRGINQLQRERREPEPLTYRGYDAALLEIAFGLIHGAGISPDDLRRCVDNFELTAKIYSEHMQKSIKEATIKLVNCGAVELINPIATEPKGEHHD